MPEMLLRLCRALAAFGVFAVDDDGQVSQTSRSAWLRQMRHRRCITPPGSGGRRTCGGRGATSSTRCEPASARSIRCSGCRPSSTCWRIPTSSNCSGRFMQHSPDDRHARSGGRVRLLGCCRRGRRWRNGALLAAILQANPMPRGVLFDHDTRGRDAHECSTVSTSPIGVERKPVTSSKRSRPAATSTSCRRSCTTGMTTECATILSNCRTSDGTEQAAAGDRATPRARPGAHHSDELPRRHHDDGAAARTRADTGRVRSAAHGNRIQ